MAKLQDNTCYHSDRKSNSKLNINDPNHNRFYILPTYTLQSGSQLLKQYQTQEDQIIRYSMRLNVNESIFLHPEKLLLLAHFTWRK